MKNIISKLNKVFDSRVRLGIMSILSVNESSDFATMKELLDVTDGNLASHMKALEAVGYVSAEKQFVGRKPSTKYSITQLGSDSLKAHIDALEGLLM